MPKKKQVGKRASKKANRKGAGKFDQGRQLDRLELELERAIATVIEQHPELPIGPDQPTMHFMAKAAMAAYEAAAQQVTPTDDN